MKGNTILLVIGGTVLIGAISYGIYKVLYNAKKSAINSPDTKTDDIQKSQYSSTDNKSTATHDFPKTKQDVAKSVYERHNEASKVFNEAVENIMDDSKSDAIITENTKNIDKIGNDLDDLLN